MRLRVCARPRVLNSPTDRSIHDEPTKRVDQGHVERREASYRFHVDSQIEHVTFWTTPEGKGQKRVHGRVAQLTEGLVTEDVEHSKGTVASARRDLRARAIGRWSTATRRGLVPPGWSATVGRRRGSREEMCGARPPCDDASRAGSPSDDRGWRHSSISPKRRRINRQERVSS